MKRGKKLAVAATLSGYRNPPWALRLGIPFTINSGNTTITGTITNPWPLVGWGSGFFGSGSVFGFLANTNYAKYTATIQSPGQLAPTISGNASVSGSFYSTQGARTTFTETLAFP